MPYHVLIRQDLDDRIWTEPIRTVALGLGVFDVGLAKSCRVAGVPVPPRGYWAQLRHGRVSFDPIEPTMRRSVSKSENSTVLEQMANI